ncbi:hypothetical protein C8D87_1011188 [Lentzea atacamensis]|uniref:Uncharacterized protein n=1 Tax=Lentzea atacamensis TaxID=531938 RepID=A0ABX9EMD7_9PSEU|nr:hypothetical protein [Lentzea atacamensis]RAS70887.1 hypothetical protein C8D87_1011188 [Lentzea atacamensis]
MATNSLLSYQAMPSAWTPATALKSSPTGRTSRTWPYSWAAVRPCGCQPPPAAYALVLSSAVSQQKPSYMREPSRPVLWHNAARPTCCRDVATSRGDARVTALRLSTARMASP